MKVAYCIRKDWDSPNNKGGDTTQLLKTMNNVLKYGESVDIEIITDAELLDGSYDIAHIFNFATLDISTEFFNKAKSLNLKVAFSTIYWDYSYSYNFFSKVWNNTFFNQVDAFLFKKIASLINKPIVLSPKFKKQVSIFMEGADILLPNSIEEYYKICEFIDANPRKFIHKVNVIYNAADVVENKYIEKKEFLEKYNLPQEPYILQIGRIQFIKGQLNLVKAMLDNNLPIVFVGAIAEEKYFNKIKRIADKRKNVYFVDYVNNKEVCNFYKYAALHVLPSLRESPGLVSLEALLNQCKIVASNETFCPFDTYFKGIATSINPLNIQSIKDGILKELNTERNFVEIQELIHTDFSWKRAGIDTFNAYKKVI
ncbi:hypothetical protein CMU59_00985 [Elizabethkingia anophelis]|uniref:glycosyltransferase n=1 Tax=Elizabethkingia anophelis TaxID=1117645 RepID=UPI00293C76B1|nr:hypothetical protein [Elizabethkingia anophelis]MDV3600527.1 hypothetical protein [Elizabethkingia anophelis]MDV3608345.1 hypothetical protein [Elizabethkingia anophelis]MDV3637231.1 hypothetical protein [Elizabethkingia anophelis]MDV3650778.1 hypothetical protein [Elizabethkingia anophelis]